MHHPLPTCTKKPPLTSSFGYNLDLSPNYERTTILGDTMNEHACKMHINHYPDTFFARPKRLDLQSLYDAKERKVNMEKGEKSHDAFTEFCIIIR